MQSKINNSFILVDESTRKDFWIWDSGRTMHRSSVRGKKDSCIYIDQRCLKMPINHVAITQNFVQSTKMFLINLKIYHFIYTYSYSFPRTFLRLRLQGQPSKSHFFVVVVCSVLARLPVMNTYQSMNLYLNIFISYLLYLNIFIS